MASEGASRRQSLGPGQRPIGMSTTGGSTASLPGALLPDSSAYGHSTAHLRGRRPGSSSSRIGSTDVLGHAVLGVPSVACILASMLQGTDPLAPMRCPGGLLLRMAGKTPG